MSDASLSVRALQNADYQVILPAMFGMKTVAHAGRRRVSRVAVSAVLALWCVFALASGDVRARCLDLGGACSPSAAVPEGPCHDQEPDGGANSSCNSCVDILIHNDAAAGGNRPDQELRAAATAHLFGFASGALLAAKGPLTAATASLIGSSSPHPLLSTAVLRI